MLSITLVCDALGTSSIGCFGNEWIATPNLDRLADEGIVFDHAFSHLDLLAGGWRCQSLDHARAALEERDVIIGLFRERAAGHATCGPTPSLDELFEEALGFLAQHPGRDVALWLEVALAPSFWDPSAESLARLLADRDPIDLRGERHGMIGADISEDEIDALRDTHAARVETFDASLGRFFDELRRRDLWESSLLAFTTDQGWPLGEHGAVGYAALWTHEERDHVPLIIKWPGQNWGSRSPSLVGTGDLGPTLADVHSAEVHQTQATRNLAPIARGEPIPPREYLVAGLDESEYSIRTQGWKLILPCGTTDPDRPRQLYVKPEDRWEIRNVADQHADVADHLELQLWRFLDAVRRGTIDDLPPLRKDVLVATA